MDFQPFRGGCMFRFLNVIAIIILLIIIITISSSSSSSSSIIIVFSVSYVFDVNSSNLRMEISQNSTATWVKNTKHRYGNHPSSQKQKSVLSCHLKKILLCQIFRKGGSPKLCLVELRDLFLMTHFHW